MGNKGPRPTQELKIDDIKIDDEAPSKATSSSTSTLNKKSKTELERGRLFEGTTEQVTFRRQGRKTLKRSSPNTNSKGTLLQQEDKLVQRQEKLARITEQSAELESEAENFASLAQQVSKKHGEEMVEAMILPRYLWPVQRTYPAQATEA